MNGITEEEINNGVNKAIKEFNLCKICMTEHVVPLCPKEIKFEDIILIELSYTDDGEETGTPYTINKRIQIRPDEQNYHCYNCYYVKLRAKENHCNKYPYCDIVAITSKK